MKVNGNKVKKITLLTALLAPMIYLFGCLFETLKGANGEVLLSEYHREYANPYDVAKDFITSDGSFIDATNFSLKELYGFSVLKDGVFHGAKPSSFNVVSDGETSSFHLPAVELFAVNDFKDSLTSEGVLTRCVSLVDLGSLSWAKIDASGGTYRFLAQLPNSIGSDTTTGATSLSSYYNLLPAGGTFSGSTDGYTIGVNNEILVFDSRYVSYSASQFKTAVTGLYVIFTYAVPVVVTDFSYTFPSEYSFESIDSMYFVSDYSQPALFSSYHSSWVVKLSNSDYLFSQFFAKNNFLAESGRKVIDGNADYGFWPAGDMIRFVDGNMFHLANVEYGALVIGYTYYAFHVLCVFLIFNLLMFFPHLIENIYEKFERGW